MTQGGSPGFDGEMSRALGDLSDEKARRVAQNLAPVAVMSRARSRELGRDLTPDERDAIIQSVHKGSQDKPEGDSLALGRDSAPPRDGPSAREVVRRASSFNGVSPRDSGNSRFFRRRLTSGGGDAPASPISLTHEAAPRAPRDDGRRVPVAGSTSPTQARETPDEAVPRVIREAGVDPDTLALLGSRDPLNSDPRLWHDAPSPTPGSLSPANGRHTVFSDDLSDGGYSEEDVFSRTAGSRPLSPVADDPSVAETIPSSQSISVANSGATGLPERDPSPGIVVRSSSGQDLISVGAAPASDAIPDSDGPFVDIDLNDDEGSPPSSGGNPKGGGVSGWVKTFVAATSGGAL